MKKFVKMSVLALLLCGGLFFAATVYVDNVNADAYRPQLARFLADKSGRAVKLNGPISFALTLHSLDITIQDAAIGNPAWASRPYMAGMGKFQVSLKLLPLLSRQVQIGSMAIENADILLETNAAGQHSWDFTAPVAPALDQPSRAVAQPRAARTEGGQSNLTIDTLTIVNSQIALRGPDGHADSYNIGSLALGMTGSKSVVDFKGDDNGHPMTLDVRTGITNLLNVGAFAFEGTASYDAMAVAARGEADVNARSASLASYEVTAAQTKMNGAATVSWTGPRVAVNGSLTSARLDPADFGDAQDGAEAPPDTAPTAARAAKPAAAPPASTRLFSDAPLPLAALRAVDADLDVTVGELPVGKTALRQIAAHLTLRNGDLDLSPVKAALGAAPIQFQLKLDSAASPPHFMLGLIGENIDLGDLQKAVDMTPFMTGHAGMNIQVSGDGDTPHAIASSLGGVVTLTAEHGTVSGGTAAGISQALGKIFNPQVGASGGDTALNCLAARFIVKGGVMTSNGLLIDTAPSVIAGKGTVNLASETVDLTLRAKTSGVDVGGLLPAVSVTGDLNHPAYTADAAAVVQNVIGQLLAGKIDVASSGVPAIATAPAGQNACAYTLDHPVATTSGPGILPADAGGKVNQQIQTIGNSLIKGLFGK